MKEHEIKALEKELHEARQNVFNDPSMVDEIHRIKKLLNKEWEKQAREIENRRMENYFM